MRVRIICALGVLSIALAVVAFAGTQEVSVEEFSADLDQWVEAVNEFIGDVRFDAADMRSFLDHYGEFSAMMDDEAGASGEEDYSEESWDDVEEPNMSESFQDLLTVMEDEQYRAWAAGNGLDPDDWMRKSVRILLLSQRTAMGEYFELADAQMQAQAADLEAQREQMGEEMYAAMKDSMTMMKMTGEAWGELPEPTAAEEQIIADHMDELTQLLQSDEGYDEWGT